MNFQKLFFRKNGKYLTIRLWSLILIDQINEKLFKKLTWAIKKNTLYVSMGSTYPTTREILAAISTVFEELFAAVAEFPLNPLEKLQICKIPRPFLVEILQVHFVVQVPILSCISKVHHVLKADAGKVELNQIESFRIRDPSHSAPNVLLKVANVHCIRLFGANGHRWEF